MKTVFSDKEMAAFSSQMALIIRAGISPFEGIGLMKEDSENDFWKQKLECIYEELGKGESLYHSLKASGGFSEYYLHMVQIGEMTGRLDEVMHALGEHFQRLHDQKHSIRSALAYPMVMIAMMVVVLVVLLTQIVPIFDHVFAQLGTTMSGWSKGILELGNFLSKYAAVCLGVVLLIIVIMLFGSRNTGIRQKIYDMLTRFPLTASLTRKLALSKFLSGMSIALRSGLDVNEGLAASEALLAHKELKNQLQKVQEELVYKDLTTCFLEQKVVTGVYAQFMKLGNKTGHVDEVMKQLADRYDEETNETIGHLIGIIEPTLVAVLSVFVGIVLLGIMLPLIGIMTGL